MVRDVRYITLTSCYRDLQAMLLTGQLKTLALVESQDSMILLGSIERLQLQSLLSLQLGRLRRLAYLQQLAQDNGAHDHDHLASLTSDSTPSSPCAHINSPASASARQAVRFLVSAQQISTEESASFSPVATNLQLPLKSAMKSVSAVSDAETPNCSQTLSCAEQDNELLETHTIFSLLGLDHAYVTSMGRLVGVVSLKEVCTCLLNYSSTIRIFLYPITFSFLFSLPSSRLSSCRFLPALPDVALHLQLRKAIEGSVTVTGVKVRPPLASFRDNGNSTNVSEVTELHKLCIRHRGLSLPREPKPPDVEEQPDLPYKEIPVTFSDQSSLQFETSPGDVSSQSSELVLQESPSFTEEPSEFTFDCSPSHTEESELACDYDPLGHGAEQYDAEPEQGGPAPNEGQSEPEGEGIPVHTEDQSK
ncbi:Chloride channel protein 2 [Liparis tanakae]|uniref:Chloride channel protein 2 n=1 Tax=Liparis tanakae TaxID=230148 RepID=A0A4Z2FA43_9TELE|nr:Chloride channel protein 2 [Liparis tanakae]